MYAHRSYRRRFWAFGLGILVLIALAGFIVQTLWNYILPGVIGVGVLTYAQALGLLILSRLLLGGWGYRGPSHWRKPLFNPRWMQMTEEEKARFSEHWKKHCDYPQRPEKENISTATE